MFPWPRQPLFILEGATTHWFKQVSNQDCFAVCQVSSSLDLGISCMACRDGCDGVMFPCIGVQAVGQRCCPAAYEMSVLFEAVEPQVLGLLQYVRTRAPQQRSPVRQKELLLHRQVTIHLPSPPMRTMQYCSCCRPHLSPHAHTAVLQQLPPSLCLRDAPGQLRL